MATSAGKRFTRRTSMVTLAAASAAVLAACGEPTVRVIGSPEEARGPAGPAGPKGAAGATGAQGAQGAQGAAGAAAKQPVEILFWSAGNQRVTDWWHAAAENGVHKKWPHITVNSVVFPPGNREDKLVTSAAAGNPPDFSVGHSTILNRLAQLGAVAPLDSSISQHKVPVQDYLPYHVAAGKFDGKQYGLCAYGGFFHTGFNKSLLDSKGAGDPKGDEAAGNWTWDRYVEMSTRITDREQGIFGTDPGRWQEWLINNGGAVISPDGTKIVLDQPEAVDAVQFNVDLIHKHRVAPTPEEKEKLGGQKASWVAGKYGFHYTVRGGHGNWGVDVGDNFVWGLVPIPRGKTKKTLLNSNGQAFVFQATKHPEEAFLAMWGWSATEGQIGRLLAGDPLTPSLLSVARSDAFLNQKIFAGDRVSRTPPDFNSFWLKEMEANNFEGHPIVPKLNQIIREANTAINRAYAGEVGARQAIEEAMPKLTSLLG